MKRGSFLLSCNPSHRYLLAQEAAVASEPRAASPRGPAVPLQEEMGGTEWREGLSLNTRLCRWSYPSAHPG